MSDAQNADNRTLFLLAQANAGVAGAIDALLQHSCDRLTRLTHRMLGDFPRVRRWAETADVLQSALMRLLNALRAAKPATPRDFLALAALQIRRELIDLARQYYGPEGIGANHASANGVPAVERAEVREGPVSLVQWGELHQHIGNLPEEEREVVGLLFYQGMAQAEAAEVLGLSLRTLQRRWHDALCKLHRLWQGR